MKVVEITEDKVDKMGDLVEGILKYGGKLMQCVNEISEDSGMGERWDDDYDEMGERGGYGRGGGYGYRGMGERRGVRGTGRYSRYR